MKEQALFMSRSSSEVSSPGKGRGKRVKPKGKKGATGQDLKKVGRARERVANADWKKSETERSTKADLCQPWRKDLNFK